MEDNVVVAVRRNAHWRWFRSEEEVWVLDQAAWARAFQEAGYDHTPDYSSRFGIPTVDETTADDFLDRATRYAMDPTALRDELTVALETATSWFDVVHCVPRLLVDFDEKRLLSLCGESEVLEKFVPRGWVSRYEIFYEEIPSEERYWEVDGKSLIEHLMK